MNTKTLARSFAGGEITPELYGRLDLAKYQTGLARCLNFTVLPHGPATRRPGFQFVNETKDSTTTTRLIPFAFSATQTVVLEFGNSYIRFIINGATLLEANVAITSIVGNLVTTTGAHGYATGDWVFILNRFFKITVTGANTFTTADLWSVAANPTASATACARVYTISSPYASADLFDLHYAQNSDVLTVTHPGYAARELKRLGATNWTLTSVTFAPPPAPGAAPGVVATVTTAGTASNQTYAQTYIAADGSESLPSATTTVGNPITLAGNYNTISWVAVAGAQRYNVYKLRGGILGYIGSTTTLSLIDDNITPDVSKAPPASIYTLNTGANDYPAAVSYHEQRRWFAGTNNAPQTVYATRSATESNLTSSIPSQDNDGLQFRIAARQQNAIRHLLPLADMIALTVGGEFRIFADSAPSITPSSLSIKPQGYSGANNVQPALTSSSILYVQSQGSRVREMAYNWQQNAYSSIDISVMAPHLFNTYSLVDLAYVRAPVPQLWCVRSDGALLGMTYVPEQQVYGWHQHTTDGFFESVCVVSEGLEDVLYAVVRRTVNGRTVRYIERLKSRLFGTLSNAFFVDSGLTYAGVATVTVSGLWHLEGRTVKILANGATMTDAVVTGGSVSIDPDSPSTIIHIGLGYNSDLMTLPLAIEQTAAGGQGMRKNVNAVALRVTESSTVKAGPAFDKLTEYPARDVSDPYGSPPALRTGEIRLAISPSWNSDGGVCIRQSDPLPLTVMSLTLDVATGS